MLEDGYNYIQASLCRTLKQDSFLAEEQNMFLILVEKCDKKFEPPVR